MDFEKLSQALLEASRNHGVRAVLDVSLYAESLGIEPDLLRSAICELIEMAALDAKDDDVLDDLYDNEP
jgi:hypothetical protein